MRIEYSTFGVGYTVSHVLRGQSSCLGLVWQERRRCWYARDNADGLFGPSRTRTEAARLLVDTSSNDA